MNDEKTAVINMVSEGAITASEGIELLEALYDLEDIGYYETDVEVDTSGHLPPWESEGGKVPELPWLIIRNEFAKAIALANREIISALQADDTEESLYQIPLNISALDLIQLLRFRLRLKQAVPGAFVSGVFSLGSEDNGIVERGWGFLMARVMNAEPGRSPTWGEPTLIQIFSVPKLLRLNWEANQVVDEEQDQVRVVSTVESFDDSVTTKAGRFDGCLKLRIVISTPGNPQFEIADELGVHDIHNSLRMVGTKLIWLAPKVGVVKFLHEHLNNTQTEIELVDYHVRDGDQLYFPLSLGSEWRYQSQDAFGVHREVIRVILHETDGVFVLSFAKYMEGTV